MRVKKGTGYNRVNFYYEIKIIVMAEKNIKLLKHNDLSLSGCRAVIICHFASTCYEPECSQFLPAVCASDISQLLTKITLPMK